MRAMTLNEFDKMTERDWVDPIVRGRALGEIRKALTDKEEMARRIKDLEEDLWEYEEMEE